MPQDAWKHNSLDILRLAERVCDMAREIKLDGGEITILKTLGLTSSSLLGKTLIERSGAMETAEFLDTLQGLIDQGYIMSNKANVYTMQDVERSLFRVNPSYAHDLKDAITPSRNRAQASERRRRRG